MAKCHHIDQAELSQGVLGVPPKANGCEDCLPEHQNWLHLRRCLTCGRVLCCEGSPGQHAKAHAVATGHGLVQSFEPGEDWIWCYPDDTFVLVADAENSPSHDGTRP